MSLRLFDRLHRWLGKGQQPDQSFRVAAIISVRTCEAYLARCFDAMIEQGVGICVIDNDANAATRAIIERYRDRGVVHVEQYPYPGYFDWAGILQRKEELAQILDADWIMLWDSDEVREPPAAFASLREAFLHVDRKGYTAVNFSEFVFLPTDRQQDLTGRDYVAGLQHYYYFEPAANHRLTAWKNLGKPIDLQESAGHRVAFENCRVFPEPFVLRHYLFLSWDHGVEKYVRRTFSDEELARGWSVERARTTRETLRLPAPVDLTEYRGDGRWDRTAPRQRHLCFDYGN